MSAIDLEAFRATPLEREPYDHLVVADFLMPDAVSAIGADYPEIPAAGSYPLSALQFGSAFANMIDELRMPAVESAFAEKFSIDLSDRPTMVTARGHSRVQDGEIHVDSMSKLITVLIYLNTDWSNQAGRLRILRSRNIEDFATEVSPRAGTLLAFRCGDRAFHGHTSFVGERRVIQLNWVKNSWVVRREQIRHYCSAQFKRLRPYG